MTIQLPPLRAARRSTKGPVFVAKTPFYDVRDIPADLGLDGSPYSADGLRVSEADYWANYYAVSDYSYEWNNGVLEEKPVSDYATFKIYKWLFLLVEAFLTSHPIGRLVALETGFRMQLGVEKATIRKPDFFVVRNDNPTPYNDADNSFHGIADLCVEALSDTSKKNRERDTKTKRIEYELAGVREFYLLDAGKQYMTFYRLDAAGIYQPMPIGADEIVRSAVLPGLQFRLVDLYQQPTLLALSEDPVYRHFVLPEYSALKARAERLAARLRELGIDEDLG